MTSVDESNIRRAGSQSGSQRFFNRAVQVFFGHPLIFLLPAILITLFGVYSGASQANAFRSVGALSVSSETFLGSLSDVRTDQFGFDTASQATSRKFNELMQTNGFTETVVENAGLSDQLASGQISLLGLRRSLYAAPAGDSLMYIIAVSENPQWARLLADSAIATFKEWVIASEVSASEAAETFYDEQLQSYQVEVDAANDALTNYILDHPAPVDPRDVRDTAEQLEIERLNDQLARAQSRLDGAVDKREAARQATRESSADIGQRLQIVDAPGVPSLPEAGLRQLAITIVLYGVLGLLASIGLISLVCVLDRSILSVADLEQLGPPVKAVVPRTKGFKVGKQRFDDPAALPAAPDTVDVVP